MFSWTDQLRRAVVDKLRHTQHLADRKRHERREVAAFCAGVISPALHDLAREWESFGRSVSVYRDAAVFHITVWYDRTVEFDYSVAACRRRRQRPAYGQARADAMGFVVMPKKVYSLREIRCTDRHKFARHIVSQYRRSLVAR